MSELSVNVSKNLEWAINVLKRFIRIPTVDPPGERYGDFVSEASKVLEELGFSVEVHEVPRSVVEKYYPEYADYPRYIVIGRLGGGKPTIQFNGHYDVVPPGAGWSTDPFKPTIKEGRLYGRGSVDMKGGIAASLLAIKAFTESFKEFEGTVEVALVPDEEIGGETGTGYLVRSGLSKPDYVIIAEPSGSGRAWIGHRGALWFYIEVYGKQAHGSTPWLGVNAFEGMVKVAEKFIREYSSVLASKRSKYIYDDPRGARPTITVGGEIRGGAKINIVPGYYAFSVDRRLIVEESVEKVEDEIRKIVEEIDRELPNLTVKAKFVNKLQPALTSHESKLVKTLTEAVKEALNIEPKLTVCLGGLDMRFYAEKEIQVVTYGPGPALTAHQADEYLEINELTKVAKVYAILLRKLLGKD